MFKTNPIFYVVAAIVGLVMMADHSMAQGCASCGSAASVESGCADCVAGGFNGHRGYQLGRNGDHPKIDEFKAKWKHHKALNHKIAARNDAWPKPFDCADRQLYFAIWEPMIDQGFEDQCVLTSVHFDEKTNELNRFGQHTVAGIMQTMPSTRKRVFIHRGGDEIVNDARLAAVTDTINLFYSETGPARVAFSSKLPIAIRGANADAITRLAIEGMQLPIIPVAAVGSISSSVDQ